MTDVLLVDLQWLKVYRRHMRHGRDVGSSQHIEIQVGRLRVILERAVGVYGFRDTVSYAVRWWIEA